MSVKNEFPFGKEQISRVQSMDEIDYVLSGTLHKGTNAGTIMVGSSSDLSLLTDYNPGSIAFTAGFEAAWQKKPDGTWKQFIGE